MSAKRLRSSNRTADAFGVSTSALDMLFCALGAAMLLFAMQERARIEASHTAEQSTVRAAVERRTTAIEEAQERHLANWPGVQALPELSGEVVFALDLSGSLAGNAQQRAQRHLVTQYVLQSQITDFGVVQFGNTSYVAVPLGRWDWDAWRTEAAHRSWTQLEQEIKNRALLRERNLRTAGVTRNEVDKLVDDGLLIKLAWLELIVEKKLTAPIVGGGTNIDSAFEKARSEAARSTRTPHVALISDGVDRRSTVLENPTSLETDLGRRVAITLVDRGYVNPRAIEMMDGFARGSGGHVVISGYAKTAETPAGSSTESVDAEYDLPLEGTPSGETP